MGCSTVSGSLICTFLFISIVYTTLETFTTQTVRVTTKTSRDIVLCNETVVVYLDGLPVYTVVGNGCKSIAKLAESYIIINNTVMFWNPVNITTTLYFRKDSRNDKVAMWPFVLIYITLRKALSLEAE